MSGHPVESLSAFLDGELAAAERADVQAHLRECPSCARHLEELAAVDALARETGVEAPGGYFDALPGRVRARIRGGRRLAPVALWSGVAAAAVAVLAAVLVPLTMMRQRSVPASVEEAPAVLPEPAPSMPPATAPFAAVPPQRSLSRAPAAAAPPRMQAPAPPAEAEALAKRREPARLRERERAGDTRADAARTPPAPAAPEGFEAQPPVPAPPAAASAPRDQARDERAASVEAMTAESAVVADRVEAEQKADPATAAPALAGRRLGAGGALGPARPHAGAEARYEVLLARTAASAAEARALRDAWIGFAAQSPSEARADEARVRAIEAGMLAWRLGGDPADLEAARAAARAYLASPEAPQAERVRRALAARPSPSAR